MVVIMGWGSGRTKDLGPVAPAVCPNCHNSVYLHQVRSDKQFSLYFVPLASYGNNEYLACPICQHALALPPAQRSAAGKMRAATASFRQGRVPQEYYRRTVDAFWAHMGMNPSGQQVMRRPDQVPPPPEFAGTAEGAAADDGPSMAEQIRDLGELRSQGVLTEEEFAAAKKKVLGS